MAVQSSSSLFTRLAFSGIRRNRGTYAPYLIACVMAVMMFYTIVSLGDNPTLRSMGGGTNMIIILNFGTWILALFSLIFLFYTNSFLIKRRKKEFGLFTILGMEKKHVAAILALETLMTGAGAILLDVSVNWDKTRNEGRGGITGDVCWEEVETLVGAITPVPGGVGAVTTAVLMSHVLSAAENQTNK